MTKKKANPHERTAWMGRRIAARIPAPKDGSGIHVTWKSLFAGCGGVLAVLTLLAFTYNAVRNIATKNDIDGLKSSLAPTFAAHEVRMSSAEERIRQLELQNAAHFGASPTAFRQSADEEAPRLTGWRFLLAQFPQIPTAQVPAGQSTTPATQVAPPPLPSRMVVVPKAMISQYKLEPTKGGTYAVLGEDGKYYSLDAVLSAHFFGTYRK